MSLLEGAFGGYAGALYGQAAATGMARGLSGVGCAAAGYQSNGIAYTSDQISGFENMYKNTGTDYPYLLANRKKGDQLIPPIKMPEKVPGITHLEKGIEAKKLARKTRLAVPPGYRPIIVTKGPRMRGKSKKQRGLTLG